MVPNHALYQLSYTRIYWRLLHLLASLPLIGTYASINPFKANPFKQHLIITYVALLIGVAELNHKLISVFAHLLASGDSDGVRSHDLQRDRLAF